MQCNYLLPRYHIILTPEKEIVPCLLQEHHSGYHVSKLSNGEYIEWLPHWLAFTDIDVEDDHFCDDECEDFVYSKLSPAKAIALIGENRDDKH